MDSEAARGILREIRTLYTLGTMGGRTDAELLERFLARGDSDAEDAFATLVARHGPMVLGVCRRMLPASQDAEDAFQATFLVLARRAASIVRRERLASWLYGVAVRTAKVARRRVARQRAGERRLMDVIQGRVGTRGGPRGPAPDPGRGVEPPAAPLPGRAAWPASSRASRGARPPSNSASPRARCRPTWLAGGSCSAIGCSGAGQPRARADRGAGRPARRDRGPRAADRPDGPRRPGGFLGSGCNGVSSRRRSHPWRKGCSR